METVLFEGENYQGRYVALRSAADKRVVASGDDPQVVKTKATQKGVTDPLIFFVPERTDDVISCSRVDG
jgi:hypothetical protein